MSAQGRGTIARVPEAMQEAMRGVTWHEELPCPRLDDLRLLTVPYFDFDGVEQHGQLVTSALLAEEVISIFSKIWDVRFPIHSIRPMTEFAGDDGRSMAANNSSCFNARRIVGTSRLSAHSYGAAIDINPVQNPVIRDGVVRPDAGATYLDRSIARPGMILEGGPVLDIFLDAGWLWGGHWENPLDYHHFYRPDDTM